MNTAINAAQIRREMTDAYGSANMPMPHSDYYFRSGLACMRFMLTHLAGYQGMGVTNSSG